MKIFSDISIWWLIPWAIIALGLTIWYYRKQKGLEDVSKWYRNGLTALRALGLFLLGALLLGLLFQAKEYKTQRPVLITMIDNSSSMLNYKDSNQVKKAIVDFKKGISSEFEDKFDIVNLLVGDGVRSEEADFTDQLSNLDEGFEHIYTQYYNQNIGGICFISDGNFNAGKNPTYSSEKIDLTPIFAIGIGDTVQKRDQLIRNVSANDLAFFRNQFPVEIDLEGIKLKGKTSEVSIWKNGKQIAKEVVTFEEENDFRHVSFGLEADKIGFARYEVKLNELENESSYANNTWSFYVEVIDSRSKVLLLSSAPHPDVAAIKNVIEKDENTEVVSMLVSDWDRKLNEYELLIWHEPGMNQTAEIFEEVKRTRTPVWYLIGNGSLPSSIESLQLGLRLPRGSRLDEAQASLNDGFQLFEVSDDLKDAIGFWPPLNVPFGTIKNASGDVLMHQRIGPVEKSDPMFYYGTNTAGKYGVTIGGGLWKWKVNEYARTKDHKGFNELVQKTVQYLVLKKNTDALRVDMPRKFTVNDDVIINAEFYNSSFEKITKPAISMEVTDSEGRKVDYEFAKKTEDYRLSLGKLKSGEYSWSATTTFNGKRYSKSGIFVVTDISLEQIESSANHTVLNQIASKSNGKFYVLGQSDQLIEDIQKRNDIASVSYEESTFRDFIDYKWVFFLVILLFGLEWFIRRRIGTY